MVIEKSQICPLCGTPATYIDANGGNRKTFKCSECSYFQISNGAEDRLKKAIQNWRDSLAEKVKSTPEGKILVITLPSSSDKAESNNLELVADYIQKSDIPN